MMRVVVDASVAIKWVVEEEGTAAALELLERHPLSAPDLLISECANILWKKVRRGELETDVANVAATLLQRADIEILPTRALMEATLKLAVELDHAAYDCTYVAVALENDWPFATADDRYRRKLSGYSDGRFNGKVLSIEEAANLAM